MLLLLEVSSSPVWTLAAPGHDDTTVMTMSFAGTTPLPSKFKHIPEGCTTIRAAHEAFLQLTRCCEGAVLLAAEREPAYDMKMSTHTAAAVSGRNRG
jgi:hypothetical protein